MEIANHKLIKTDMENKEIKILVVDDEANFAILLRKVLQRRGYDPVIETDAIRAKELLEQESFDLVISDLEMPGIGGMELLKLKDSDTTFIIITGYGSVDSAVEAMKVGAFDYINKPFDMDEFTRKIEKAIERIRLSKISIDGDGFDDTIIGKSRKMQKVYSMIESVSQSNTNVLIEGQSGTGKELVARAIHKRSDRKNGPFIAINCSAIPDTLLESELFGHTKGAYTGAMDKQTGVFELANGGTLLLDEIAEMPYNLQSKLLRVIEEWEIKPLGSDKVKKIDVRLISATNQDIAKLIDEKRFREDLFYRISTFTISLPGLDERRDDIPLLVNHFLKILSGKLGRNYTIKSDALEMLVNRNWKGNVRELENALEHAIITCEGDTLDKNCFRFLNQNGNGNDHMSMLGNMDLKDLEKNYIKKILEDNGWNKLQAANVLGIDRKTLYNKIKLYKLE